MSSPGTTIKGTASLRRILIYRRCSSCSDLWVSLVCQWTQMRFPVPALTLALWSVSKYNRCGETAAGF